MEQGHSQIETGGQRAETQSRREPTLMEISVSTVVFSFDGARLRIMGIPKGESGQLTLPRHTFESGMSLTDAASLAVKKVNNTSPARVFQVGVFSPAKENENDEAALEISFFTVIPRQGATASQEGGESVGTMEWVYLEDLSRFDAKSREAIEAATQELRKRSRFEDIAFSLLPTEFSLSELQKMFEAVMGRSIDVRNFRKKIDSLDILLESPHKPKGVAHRPPRLYSFSPDRFKERVATEGEIRFF